MGLLAMKVRSMNFFDRNIFKKKWQWMNNNPLTRSAGLVRKIARGSIRRVTNNRPSKSGKPPRSRDASGAMKRIFYVTDTLNTQAIVGLVGFGTDTVPTPAVHEHGLRALRWVKVADGKQRRNKKGQFRKQRKKFVKKMVQYPKRSFMEPALRKARPKIPSFWRGSIK